MAQTQRLVACEFFRIDKTTASAGFADEIGEAQPTLWMVLEGKGELTGPDFDPVGFGAGDTLLLPPRRGTDQIQVEVSAAAQWLEISFPQAQSSRLA